MNKNLKSNVIKATIKDIIVAFIYVIIIVGTIYVMFSSTIRRAINLIEIVSEDNNKDILSDVKLDLKTKNLESYPKYGSKYGSIEIPSLNIKLPLYYGDSLNILRYGVGHTSYTYFPGEGGTILCMGHNTYGMLRKLPETALNSQTRSPDTYYA